MDLPNLFKSNSSAPTSFLALLISDHFVQAGLWLFEAGSNRLLEKSATHSYLDDQDCVVQADRCLQELGKVSEGLDEVVFGLEPSWVSDTGVLDIKKPLLKQLTQELSLTAVGFVVTSESLHHLLIKTQTQLSVLVLQSESTQLRLSFIRQGALIKSEMVGKSGDVVADLLEALARWTPLEELAAAYPSRILLFSQQLTNEELVAEEQLILAHDWLSFKIFLHPPVVEILGSSMLMEAVIQESGRAMAISLGKDSPIDEPRPEGVEEKAVGLVTKASLFGVQLTPSQLASLQGGSQSSVSNSVPEVALSDQLTFDQPHFIDDLELTPHKKYSHRRFVLAGVGLGLILSLVGGYFYLNTMTRAIVSVQLKTVPVTKQIIISLLTTTEAATGAANLSLPAQTISKDFEKTKTIPTTGIKKVGEKAKGTAILFNKTTSVKTFASGTQLSSGSLIFTLDQEVVVASASVTTTGASETKNFGQSDVAITASLIGTDSNIAKDLELKIASFDSGTYAAQTKTALTGGASREVRVVAAADQASLLAQLRADIQAEATTTFRKDSEVATYTVPSGQLTAKETVYSAKIGEEVGDLTLRLVAAVEGVVYQTKQIEPLSLQALADQVPAGYELQPDKLEIKSEAKASDSTASSQVFVVADVTALARPQLNLDELKNQLAGKSLSEVEATLRSQATLNGFAITFSPGFSRWFLSKLPPSSRLMVSAP